MSKKILGASDTAADQILSPALHWTLKNRDFQDCMNNLFRN